MEAFAVLCQAGDGLRGMWRRTWLRSAYSSPSRPRRPADPPSRYRAGQLRRPFVATSAAGCARHWLSCGRQRRWRRASGKISSSAFQKPRAPSPMASSGCNREPAPAQACQAQLSASSGRSRAPPPGSRHEFLASLPDAGADEDQNALLLVLGADPGDRCISRPTCTDVAGRDATGRAGDAALVLGLRLRLQAADHLRRQARGVLAEQRLQRLLEVPAGHATKVERRQKRIQRPRPPLRNGAEWPDVQAEALSSDAAHWQRRTFGRRTDTGPMPVRIARTGAWPWRTRRRRPSSVFSVHAPPARRQPPLQWPVPGASRAPARSPSVERIGRRPPDGAARQHYLPSWRITPCLVQTGRLRHPPQYATSFSQPVTHSRPASSTLTARDTCA